MINFKYNLKEETVSYLSIKKVLQTEYYSKSYTRIRNLIQNCNTGNCEGEFLSTAFIRNLFSEKESSLHGIAGDVLRCAYRWKLREKLAASVLAYFVWHKQDIVRYSWHKMCGAFAVWLMLQLSDWNKVAAPLQWVLEDYWPNFFQTKCFIRSVIVRTKCPQYWWREL
jgi:hypothetical protein